MGRIDVDAWLKDFLVKYNPAYQPTLVEGFLNEEHEAFARATFKEVLGDPIVKWMLHLSRTDENSRLSKNKQWICGFPHRHDWPMSMTLVVFLKEPRSGGELIIEEAEIKPKAGSFATMFGEELHGVRPCEGERISVITTGWLA